VRDEHSVRLSLVLPTLDERENVETFVPRLFDEIPELAEIIVVDDGSTDGTRDVVRRLALEHPRLRLLERSGPPCLAASLQEGIDAATGDHLGWMDADQAMMPADFRRLMRAVEEGADMAVGSRFALGGAIKGQVSSGFWGRIGALRNVASSEDSWQGVALSWALNGLVLPMLLGDGVRDYTSGIVVMKREALREIRLRGDHGEYFIDLWVRARRRGLKVVEVAYQVQPRLYGHSKTGASWADYIRRGKRYLRTAIATRG
jgi:dolichol-phosphate mannosyltransferase